MEEWILMGWATSSVDAHLAYALCGSLALIILFSILYLAYMEE
jgi:hypothetical protein